MLPNDCEATFVQRVDFEEIRRRATGIVLAIDAFIAVDSGEVGVGVLLKRLVGREKCYLHHYSGDHTISPPW